MLRSVQGLVEELKKLRAGVESAMTPLVDKARTICFQVSGYRACLPERVPEGASIQKEYLQKIFPLFAGSGGGAEKAEGG